MKRQPERKPPAAGTRTSTIDALENALCADPDDLAAHAAFADLLMEQGDPRGEFIQVQLALEDESRSTVQRRKLKRHETALLKKHRRDWLGQLEPIFHGKNSGVTYQFARGWLSSLKFAELNAAVARVLADAAQLRLLRELIIEEIEFEFDGETEGFLTATTDALLHCRYLGNVEKLEISTMDEGPLKLIQKMHRLQKLDLNGRMIDAAAVFRMKTLTELRYLHVNHLGNCKVEVLARNPVFGKLKVLLLEPASPITLKGVQALVRSPHLKNLQYLGLAPWGMGDACCQEIVGSGILSRLKGLDLGDGSITDEGARILAGCPDLKNLEFLGIRNNNLTNAGIRLLRKLGMEIEATGQRPPGDDGEEYLLADLDME